MDVFTAMKERRSCRNFLPDPVGERELEQILEAGTWAPSPLNGQPWEFVIVTNTELKENIFIECDQYRQKALEISGWKWLGKYRVDFLKSAPVIIAISGDPKKSGADSILEEGGGNAYQHACAACIQNITLAAHALGFGSLWYTLFDKVEMRKILDSDPGKKVLALLCIGKPGGAPIESPRINVKEKTRHIR